MTVHSIRYQLCIAGDGVIRNYLEGLVLQLGIADRVRFLGVRYDVSQLMSAADVFVLSSFSEGFGLVVAEAMACERVVVATDCGGVGEVLSKMGYLVKPKDSDALTQSLQLAIKLTADQRRKLGSAARQRVIDNFSLKTMVEQWMQLYENKKK